jgi:IMP dehydrogenase
VAQVIPEISRTFNEFLLLPNRTRTDCTAALVDLTTAMVRHRAGSEPAITLNCPVTSAIMQAVSSPPLAIALARNGGLAFVHHNQPVADQVLDVRRVKNFKAGFVTSDTNVRPADTLATLTSLMRRTGHSTAAVTDDGTSTGTLLGLVTSRDFHPDRHGLDQPVSARMIGIAELPCGRPDLTLSEANGRLWDERLDCLPIVTEAGKLEHLVFRSDYADNKRFPAQLVDPAKRLRVGAGINTHDYEQRVPALVEAGADVLCFDSSDGYSDWQARALAWVKARHPQVPVGGGNVVDGEAFLFLAEAGADFIKVGVGGGAICITRDQKGIGRGQASAIMDVAAARDAYFERTGDYVPICSDGGLKHDYHIALALAMGADFVMMGRYFARFDQASGAKVATRDGLVKEFWGEGSNRARNWQRYGHDESGLAFEEGVDGFVPYAGDLSDGLAATVAKVKATMVSCGSASLAEFRSSARLTLVSEQSFAEGQASVIVRDTVGELA